MFERSTVAHQAASYLKEEIMKGRWRKEIPGRGELARELGVHGSTVERAFGLLEQEGWLQGQGPGRPRRVAKPGKTKKSGANVFVVLYEGADIASNRILDLRNQLQDSGHRVTFAPKTLRDLKFDPPRVESMIRNHAADAIIVQAGTKAILERTAMLRTPVFALFGPMTGVPVAGAGPDKLPALRETMRCLFERGHRRIVMLSRSHLQSSQPSLIARTFLEELRNLGIPSSSYNLPSWENSPQGLAECLGSLFRVTPPTAIFIDDWMLHNAIQMKLIRERGASYRNVSCVCTDFHPSFLWCQERIPYFDWDVLKVEQRAVRWVENIIRKKEDREQTLIPARLVNESALTVVK